MKEPIGKYKNMVVLSMMNLYKNFQKKIIVYYIMKKLIKCNNVMINSLIIIGIFIVFFYLYSSIYSIEGFYNFDGTRTIWDKKSDLETKLDKKRAEYERKVNPVPTPQKGTYHSCGVLTSYGKSECNAGRTMEGQRCLWDTQPTNYQGGGITNSVGGTCEGVY